MSLSSPIGEDSATLEQLREENARLKALLADHGIDWEQPVRDIEPSRPDAPIPAELTTEAKIALFRRLFQGRTDMYPVRWESSKGTSGYSPACGNEWKSGVCRKPRVKCGQCDQRLLLPLTDQVIYDHLVGQKTIGVYPLLEDDHCRFLAVDFDKGEWRDDAKAFMDSCREFSIPAALEISRSGNGAHVWIFFSQFVPAMDARRLGAALISHTCDRIRQLSLASYDRLFPNQDTLPKGGFGNLIALPLQKQPRGRGCSVFVDQRFQPYPDQWAFLASIEALSPADMESVIHKISGDHHPLDVGFTLDADEEKPWQHRIRQSEKIAGVLPRSLTVVVADQLYIAKAELPQPLTNRLIRLAAFQNPEFYKAQAMRFPVWNKPRIIGCAESFPKHIGLPRGCLDNLLSLLADNDIQVDIQDECIDGNKLGARFVGKLRKDQKVAVKKMLQHDTGVFCAPTAFGKTVTAAAMIARRKVSTLILVHRTELQRQWQERLIQFLDLGKDKLGLVGGGRKKPSGRIDIAVMQTLSRWDGLQAMLDQYGQIIVDECHHLSAFSFEAILKQAKARYILGLTATPVRRDGHHPIIFMQCGPIRHRAARPETALVELEVKPRFLSAPPIPPDSAIQSVFRQLYQDAKRNEHIMEDVRGAYNQGRKVLLLTERTDHLGLLQELLEGEIENCFLLHGRLSKKQRASVFAELDTLPESAPRLILATGRLVGEGFDHPPLDTLVLALPVSWKGTLQQYAGRLHRESAGKQSVWIYDYVETDLAPLARMWEKRRKGYKAMGYQILDSE